MQGGTIVQRKASTFIPNEYLEAVLAANPNCWGATMVGEEGLQLNSGEEGASLEFIQETMKTFEDKDITFYFGHSDAALNKADIPPYILIVKKDGEEEVPQIVGFFDGNFPAYDKGGSSHPPEYHLAVDYLIPKLEGLWEIADGDLNKVTTQLQKPHFRKELLLTSVSRGTITLVCANGVALTFAQSDLSGEFPWGWVSNTHGYKAEAMKAPDKPAKRASMFEGKSTVREKVGAQPDNVTEATKELQTATGGFPKGSVPADKLAEATAAAKTDTAVKGYTVKKWRPDSGASRSQKKDQYKMRIGYLPKGWKDKEPIEIDVYYNPEGKIMTFDQVKKLGLQAAAIMALAKNPPAERDIEPHEVRSEDTRPTEKVVTEVLPIMPPATKERIKAMMRDPAVQKIIAENADIIENPAVVQAIEAKFTDFARQLGEKSIDAFIPWSYGMMLDLGKTDPEGLAVMCWTYRNMVASNRTKKAEAAVAKVEDVVSPKRRGMFDRAVG